LYSQPILAWCMRWGFKDVNDAEVITAEVLFKLARRMKSFEYDPTKRFRNWLKAVIDNAVKDFLKNRARRPVMGDLAAVPDPSLAGEELYQQIEAQRQLLSRAMVEVHGRVKPHTWAAFNGTAIEGRAPAAVAAELDMTTVAVHQAKKRVLDLIRQAVAR